MNSTVFRITIFQVRRTLVILPIASAAFYYLVLLSLPTFLTDRPGGIPFLEDPPRFMQAFLGGSADFFHPSGWVALSMTHPITLALLVGAALTVSAGAVATEVERGTIDLALARPVGRTRFLMAKAAAALLAVTLVELGGFAALVVARVSIDRVDEIDPAATAVAFAGSWLLFAAIAMMALLVSSRSSLRGRATGIAVGLVVGTYFANFISLLIDGAADLRFISPFHYFRAGELLGGQVTLAAFAILAGLAAVALAGAVYVFRRRDLTS